jgi:hypothetical protein
MAAAATEYRVHFCDAVVFGVERGPVSFYVKRKKDEE